MENQKIIKVVKSFLDAWIKDKSRDINRSSYSENVDVRAKKTLFETVKLSGYEVISYDAIDGDSVGVPVDMALNIRGKARKKRLLIYAIKRKNGWKVDLKTLLPS